MLGVLLRKLVAAGRGQDLSAVGDLEFAPCVGCAPCVGFAPCVGILNIRFGSDSTLVWSVG